MHKYRRLLGEVLAASFFLQVFALISPLFFQVVVDKVLVHRGLTTLDVLIVGLLTLSLFESVLATLRTFVFSHTTNRIDVELGARLFQHLLALPIAYFEARRAGDSVARVRELENIRNFLTSSALTLVVDLVFTSVFLAVMFYYSPLLTWIVIASLPFYAGISIVLTPIFRRRLEIKFDRGAENQAFLVETVSGVETLKALAVEPQIQKRWEEQLATYVRASFHVLSLGNSASQAVQFISKVVTAAILYFGAKAVIDGDMTVGELVAFNMLAGRVAQPVLRLAQVWQDFHQARVSVERLGDILNTAPEPTYSSGQASLPKIKGTVTFDHVSFRYRLDSRQVLQDVDLKIAAGQVVGIVGPSGSGKSTLTKLVQRLYVPESGRVLIDGIDIGLVDAAWLRRQIGVVLQENVLFNRSIRENIALADPGLPTGSDCRRRRTRRRTRIHSRIAERLRHDGRRTRCELVGRPAPTHCHCPRSHRRPPHPDLRRGDERARLRERTDHPGQHAADRHEQDGADHRSSLVDRPLRRSDPDAGRRPSD